MDDEWNCANCGKPLLPGEDIIHSASGTVSEDGDLEVGDHFYMHAECPTVSSLKPSEEED